MKNNINNFTDNNNNSQNPFISIEKIKPDLRKKDPPLVDMKVANPITYIKSWWKKIIGNEGMDIRIKIKPLTAILITVIVVTLSLGITKLALPFDIPFLKINEEVEQTEPVYRKTAFVGYLRYIKNISGYYLETDTSEAITLEIPLNINLDEFIGRRIFAAGEYYDESRLLKVSDVSDLEIFPENVIPIPTTEPTPIPTNNSTMAPTPTVGPILTEEPSSTPTVIPVED